MRLDVTQEDIDEARSESRSNSYIASKSCPMAKAMNRQFGDGWLVTREWIKNKWSTVYLTPTPKMVEFIDQFDLGIGAEPQTFQFQFGSIQILD